MLAKIKFTHLHNFIDIQKEFDYIKTDHSDKIKAGEKLKTLKINDILKQISKRESEIEFTFGFKSLLDSELFRVSTKYVMEKFLSNLKYYYLKKMSSCVWMTAYLIKKYLSGLKERGYQNLDIKSHRLYQRVDKNIRRVV